MFFSACYLKNLQNRTAECTYFSPNIPEVVKLHRRKKKQENGK